MTTFNNKKNLYKDNITYNDWLQIKRYAFHENWAKSPSGELDNRIDEFNNYDEMLEIKKTKLNIGFINKLNIKGFNLE